jgi:hypothetical protein
VSTLLVAGGPWIVAQEPPAVPPPAAEAQSEKPAQRIREGTPLDDVSGRFKMMGDRAMFYMSDNSAKYSCLENLNLERVTNQIAENPETSEWTISGTITEYRGSNYLLLSRAIMKSRPTTAPRLKRPSAAKSAQNKPAEK